MHEPTASDLPEEALDRVAEIVGQDRRVAVSSGTGVSAGSGVPTFRGAFGALRGTRRHRRGHSGGLSRDPALVWRFYNARRAQMEGVSPNPGHVTLAAPGRDFGNRFTLATQNIDGLHQVAGSRNVLELHGRMSRVRCTARVYLVDCPGEALPELPLCPECGAMLRPDIVRFEELLSQAVWREAYTGRRARRCPTR